MWNFSRRSNGGQTIGLSTNATCVKYNPFLQNNQIIREQGKIVNLIKKPNRQIKTAKDKVIKDCKFCGRTHNRGECPTYGKESNHFANICLLRKVVK